MFKYDMKEFVVGPAFNANGIFKLVPDADKTKIKAIFDSHESFEKHYGGGGLTFLSTMCTARQKTNKMLEDTVFDS